MGLSVVSASYLISSCPTCPGTTQLPEIDDQGPQANTKASKGDDDDEVVTRTQDAGITEIVTDQSPRTARQPSNYLHYPIQSGVEPSMSTTDLSPGERFEGAVIVVIEAHWIDADGVKTRVPVGVETCARGTEISTGQRGPVDDLFWGGDSLGEEVAVVVGHGVVAHSVFMECLVGHKSQVQGCSRAVAVGRSRPYPPYGVGGVFGSQPVEDEAVGFLGTELHHARAERRNEDRPTGTVGHPVARARLQIANPATHVVDRTIGVVGAEQLRLFGM